MKKRKQAKSDYNTIQKKFEKEIALLQKELLAATEIFLNGNIEKAFNELLVLEKKHKENILQSWIYTRYATFFHLLEQDDEAMTALAQSLSMDPQNPRANYLMSIHLMADEKWNEATDYLYISINNYPINDKEHLAEAYGNLAYCYQELGDNERALMFRDISYTLDPSEDYLEEEIEENTDIKKELENCKDSEIEEHATSNENDSKKESEYEELKYNSDKIKFLISELKEE